MRVFFTGNVGESLPPPYAGIPKRALLMARMMREVGHEVAMAFMYRHETEDDLDAGATYYFDYNRKPSKLDKVAYILRSSFENPLLYTYLVWRYFVEHHFISRECLVNAAHGVMLNREFLVWKPDLIVSEAAIIRTFMAAEVAKRLKIPMVFDTYAEVHDESVLKLRGGAKHRRQYWTRFLAIPERIIAPSHYCAKGPLLFAPPEKVEVIYAGIEVDTYSSVALTKQEARSRLGLPQEGFHIVAVGSLAPRKGHDHTIKAIAKLSSSVDAHAIICGPGDNTWLRDLAHAEGVGGRVHFFTELSESDLIALYRASDVYSDASNTPRACLGMSVTEAMAVGMPIVSYKVGGLSEIVREGVNGFLVPLDDIDALAQALERVSLLEESEYRRFSQEGQRLAKELVDLEVCTKQMIDTLEGVYHRARQ